MKQWPNSRKTALDVNTQLDAPPINVTAVFDRSIVILAVVAARVVAGEVVEPAVVVVLLAPSASKGRNSTSTNNNEETFTIVIYFQWVFEFISLRKLNLAELNWMGSIPRGTPIILA